MPELTRPTSMTVIAEDDWIAMVMPAPSARLAKGFEVIASAAGSAGVTEAASAEGEGTCDDVVPHSVVTVNELAFSDTGTVVAFQGVQITPQSAGVTVVVFTVDFYLVVAKGLTDSAHSPVVAFGNTDVVGDGVNSFAADCPFGVVAEILCK